MRRVMPFMLAGVFSLALVSKAWTGPDLRRAVAAVTGLEAEGWVSAAGATVVVAYLALATLALLHAGFGAEPGALRRAGWLTAVFAAGGIAFHALLMATDSAVSCGCVVGAKLVGPAAGAGWIGINIGLGLVALSMMGKGVPAPGHGGSGATSAA